MIRPVLTITVFSNSADVDLPHESERSGQRQVFVSAIGVSLKRTDRAVGVVTVQLEQERLELAIPARR